MNKGFAGAIDGSGGFDEPTVAPNKGFEGVVVDCKLVAELLGWPKLKSGLGGALAGPTSGVEFVKLVEWPKLNNGLAFGVVDSTGSGVVDGFSTTLVSPNLNVGAGAGAALPKGVDAGEGDDAAGNEDDGVWPNAGVNPFDCGCEPKSPALNAGFVSSCGFGCPKTLLPIEPPALDD